MDHKERLEEAVGRLGQLHRYRDMIWENIDSADEIYHPILFIIEDAIQRQLDKIANLNGTHIEKRHRNKKYVFEVRRNRLGAADVYINGELVVSLLDEIVEATESDKIQTDIVKGCGSRIPDAVFVKSLLYSPSDNLCHLSDKVKAILDRDIPEDIRKMLDENIARMKR